MGRGAGTCGGFFGILVGDFLDADGGDEEGAFVAVAEEGDGEVATGGLAQHQWTEAVALEGGDVPCVGGFAAGGAVDVHEIGFG